MNLGLFAVPISLFLGILLGIKIKSTKGMILSSLLGASSYIASLIGFSGPASVLTFDIFTQILMIIFGAISSLIGWFIGSNLDLFIGSKKLI